MSFAPGEARDHRCGARKQPSRDTHSSSSRGQRALAVVLWRDKMRKAMSIALLLLSLAAYAARTDTRYRLAAAVRLVRVRVWETTSSWAEYENTH